MTHANITSITKSNPIENNVDIHLPAGVDVDRKNFDVGQYLAQLDDFEISEQEKTELLLILHDIMKRFVELGWGIDSVSLLDSIETDNKNNTE